MIAGRTYVIAGGGTAKGTDDGIQDTSAYPDPYGVAVDSDGNVLIAVPARGRRISQWRSGQFRLEPFVQLIPRHGDLDRVDGIDGEDVFLPEGDLFHRVSAVRR